LTPITRLDTWGFGLTTRSGIMNVTNVTIYVIEKPNGPETILIIKDLITGGAGNLEESIIGGQVKYALKLTKGHEARGGLKKGESVSVKGTNETGDEFTLPVALQVVEAHRPWSFTGQT
jgi:hypothetical protein